MNIGNAADKLFCQEGWHRPALSLFAKVSLVFSCKLPKTTRSQKFAFAKRMVRFRSFAAYVRTEKATCCVRTYAAKRPSSPL